MSLYMDWIIQGRPTGGINEEKAVYAKDHKHMTGLEEICRELKPSVAIGDFQLKVLRILQANTIYLWYTLKGFFFLDMNSL